MCMCSNLENIIVKILFCYHPRMIEEDEFLFKTFLSSFVNC